MTKECAGGAEWGPFLVETFQYRFKLFLFFLSFLGRVSLGFPASLFTKINLKLFKLKVLN